jgi:hypothetical protein
MSHHISLEHLTFTRRELLTRVGMGMGALGLAPLLDHSADAKNPLAVREPHIPVKANGSSTCS